MGGDQSNIAFWAHLGGFVAGVGVGWSIKPWWKSNARGELDFA
jgi:membrane associated rhomboid family serine protease